MIWNQLHLVSGGGEGGGGGGGGRAVGSGSHRTVFPPERAFYCQPIASNDLHVMLPIEFSGSLVLL